MVWIVSQTTIQTGSIDSRVKANPTYGQSIVSYTGSGTAATIGHGLSSAPEVISKNRDVTNEWRVYHTAIGNTLNIFFRLNTTAAK